MLHEETVSDDGPYTAGSQVFSGCGYSCTKCTSRPFMAEKDREGCVQEQYCPGVRIQAIINSLPGTGNYRPVSVIQQYGEVEKTGIGTLHINRAQKAPLRSAFWGGRISLVGFLFDFHLNLLWFCLL